jgi:phenylalanyl-tRNA synthetase beta chain
MHSKTTKNYKFEPFTHSCLQPGQAAAILRGNQMIGCLGAFHPKIAQELDIDRTLYLFDLNLESIMDVSFPIFETISKFPMIRRDIALVIASDVPAERIRKKILDSGGKLLKNVQIFDVYQGKGIELSKKSIAFGLFFQDISRTLIDSEVNQTMQVIIDDLHKEFGATLRD